MISVVCCWNNEKQYNDVLLASLKRQNCLYELVSIDNRENMFSSCAAALNFGARKSNGDVVIFVHQDISFDKDDSLEKFAQFIKEHSSLIVGTYGAAKHPYEEKYLCDTVDECCFGMTKESFDLLGFNEKVCDSWHLYAVELCLRGKDIGIRGDMKPRNLSFFGRKCGFELHEKVQTTSCYL